MRMAKETYSYSEWNFDILKNVDRGGGSYAQYHSSSKCLRIIQEYLAYNFRKSAVEKMCTLLWGC